MEFERVAPEPVGPAGSSLGLGELPSLADATGSLSGSGEATEFPVLHDGPGHPVDLGIPTDCLVSNVDQDHLEVLVGGVLANPVAVQDTETLEAASNTFLRDKGKMFKDGV